MKKERFVFDLSAILRQKSTLTLREQIGYMFRLSVPAMLAQVSSILMQYIDAAMVGKLGAESAASIGLVASSTWLLGGMVASCAAGFTVQVAQCVGAGTYALARNVLRQGIVVCTIFSLVLAFLGTAVSGVLPVWLGAEEAICTDASSYFRICTLSLPVWQLSMLMGGALRSSGDMKIPSALSVLLCVLDVAGNYLFIFVMHLGVTGAALGTMCAECIVALLMTYFCAVRSPLLSLCGRKAKIASADGSAAVDGSATANGSATADIAESWHLEKACLGRARSIAVPMGFQQFALCGAQIMSTRLIAPLGTVSIAANSFAVTAEALCYMPGHGVADAATTMVGQSVGAKRRDLARHFAWVSIAAGMAVMAFAGLVMYIASPALMAFLTPDSAVRALGVEVLRIEMFAEPLFAASIVASGVLRGAGDTLIPGILNLVSMWGCRIVLIVLLVPHYGLKGAWIAMCAELCFRGVLFLIRVKRERWLK